MRGKHLNILFIKKMRHAVGSCTVVQKTSVFGSFFNPRIIIAVTVENNIFMVFDCFANHFVKSRFKIVRFFEPVGINLKALRNCGVKHNICTCNAV